MIKWAKGTEENIERRVVVCGSYLSLKMSLSWWARLLLLWALKMGWWMSKIGKEAHVLAGLAEVSLIENMAKGR
jgi:hypothetical protein